jgi:NitT/TauT family transport system substrate-binding protein
MSGHFWRRIAGWTTMVLVAAALGHLALAADGTAKAVVRFSLNPVTLGNLPIFVAVDKGYFAAQNIDLRLTKYGGSSVTQMPLAARGDLDITMMVAGPALFNQQREGFDLKIIASVQQTRAGWSDGEWIIVRKDLWDSGAIRTLADFKGRRVDGGPDGSPISLVMNLALAKAGLTRGDMIYSKKLASPADWVAVFRNKAVDVIAAAEPVASLVESQRLGHKFISDQDVAPWFQVNYLIASEKYIQDHRATVTAFLKAYLEAARDITASGQKWNPALLHEVAKWSQLKEADIASIPGPSYYGQLGAINRVSLTRQQDYLAEIGQVKAKIDIASLIDDGPLLAARHEMAIQ